ncbi:MAG TPA: hypothetical protein PK752_03785 [Accumulibacter sp.]|uniref:hypothetical protein n=1 Tax=Accumulibacter sp. TaxID=2053492 RepID=UPI002C7BDF83|nr:hypothetical protein [Accumulibacter sp.]HRD87369.1 hypothetical protein [Accumulibacter sp.]
MRASLASGWLAYDQDFNNALSSGASLVLGRKLAEQARIIQLLVDRVTVSPTGLRIDMKTAGMKELIQSVMPGRKVA